MIKFYSLSLKSEQNKNSTKNLNENKNGNVEEGRKQMLFFCFVVIKWKSTLYEDEGRKEKYDEKWILKFKTRHYYYYDWSNPFCFVDIQISSVKVNIPCKKTNKQTEIRLQQSNIKTHKNCIIIKQSKTKNKNSDKVKYRYKMERAHQ